MCDVCLLDDQMDNLAGHEVCDPEEGTGNDDETQHDAGGLKHLLAVRPLYSLQLAPAPTQEAGHARRQRCPRLAFRKLAMAPGSCLAAQALELAGAWRLTTTRAPQRHLRGGEVGVRRGVSEAAGQRLRD
jgi:hypothetical protein